jgi:outer membrane protein assembly factor BamA
LLLAVQTPATAQFLPEEPGAGVPGIPDGVMPDEQSPTDDETGEAEQVVAEMEGETVVRIDFDCDLTICDNPVSVEKLRELSGLYVGMEFSRAALRRAENRLAKTGFFESIESTTNQTGEGVALSLQAKGAVLVRKVKFNGIDGPPFESDLKKLLIFRQGQAYREDRSKASAQLRTLRNEFEKEGYFGTQISMYVRPVEDDDHLVDITFSIDKGKELLICDIGIRGLRSMPYEEAREELLASHSVLTRRFELIAPTFTTRVFKEGQEALIDHYREQGFFQARIVGKIAKKNPEKGCVTILADISEGPQWKLEFGGDVFFSDEELRRELPFYESGYVDAEEIRRAERAIRQLYETRGYPFAAVQGVEKRRDRLDRVIRFEIEAGERIEIRDLILHGNQRVSSLELLANFGTRRFGLFDEGGYLQSEQLLGDLAKLEAVYRDKGFLQATVERFELEVLRSEKALRIHIYIDEGEQTEANRVSFNGNRTVTDGILQSEVEVRTGDPFVPLELKADRSRLVQLYSSYGYPMAQVETSCRTMTGEDVQCQAPKMPSGCVATSVEDLEELCHWSDGPLSTRVCRRIRRERGCEYEGGVMSTQVRVDHRISEGPFVRVGEILLKGNFDTSTSLIYQELPLKTGDLFDVRKLLEGQGNMRSLGVFDSVSIEAIGLDEQSRSEEEVTAALIISVEESRNRYLDFKFGFEGRDLLGDTRRLLVTGETQYNDDNFFGRAQRFRPRLIGAFDAMQLFEAGTDSAGLAGASQPVGDLDYLVGAELVYNHPRFLKGLTDIDKLSLTVAPFYLLDLLGVNYDNVLREEWGLRLEVRKQLTEILERLYLSIGIEGKQAALWTPSDPMIDGERVFSPRRVTGKLVPELTLDRRDSPLNPKEGYYVQVQPGLVTGATLVQGGENAIEDAYLRLVVTTNFYLEVLDDVVLGQGLRYGHVLPFFGRDRLVTEDERFRLGGAGSVRGFANNTLGPLRNLQPSGGEFMLNYNAELRYPLIKGINLYGAAFFDAGLLADCFGDAQNNDVRVSCYDDAFATGNPFDKVRTAAGLGIRYLIVDQIPVVVDYGMVLDRRPSESFGTLHFNLGYTF